MTENSLAHTCVGARVPSSITRRAGMRHAPTEGVLSRVTDDCHCQVSTSVVMFPVSADARTFGSAVVHVRFFVKNGKKIAGLRSESR